MMNMDQDSKPKSEPQVRCSNLVRTRQLYVLCVEDVPVGYTEDADWAVRWENQLHCRYIKVVPEIVPAES
jgi:hypothetical protein